MTTPSLATTNNIGLERMLQSAVVLSWTDLVRTGNVGVIHVECHVKDSSLDYLRVWSSRTRGYWDLVCEYWMRPSWSRSAGITFGSGYHSADLARNLEFVMQHQDAFANHCGVSRDGLIQLHPPTKEEILAAERYMSEALAGASSPAEAELRLSL